MPGSMGMLISVPLHGCERAVRAGCEREIYIHRRRPLAANVRICTGMYTVLIFLSTRMFLKRGLKARTNQVILGITTFMYLLSAAFYAYSVADVVDRMQIDIYSPCNPHSVDFTFPHDAVTKWSDVFNAVVLINYVLSDSVVVWRAWVICRDRRKYLWITIGFLVLTAASVVCTIVFRIVALIESPLEKLAKGSSLNEGIDILQLSNLVWSLLSNLSATAAVGVCAWHHRQLIREAFKDTKSTKADKILILIAESGVVYCVATITTIISGSIRLPEGTVGDLYMPLSIQISGAYPLVVLLLANAQQSLSESTFFDAFGTI
ncbi:hypothetical protein B0H17DRAFT_1059849 [Mycena rosella]|uniref:Uncharacterized protein n=1 Tax=Mycena rosella TaxID=1033263 RepID=A0AAD7DKG2_MYCRO|nr:hypothetical protein B0H17DRAFT_1059849 [Mycena rosella]